MKCLDTKKNDNKLEKNPNLREADGRFNAKECAAISEGLLHSIQKLEKKEVLVEMDAKKLEFLRQLNTDVRDMGRRAKHCLSVHETV